MKVSKIASFLSLIRHFRNQANVGDYLVLQSQNIYFPIINKANQLANESHEKTKEYAIENHVFCILTNALEKKQDKLISFFTQDYLDSFNMKKFVQSLIFRRNIDSFLTLKEYLPNIAKYLPDNSIEALYVEGILQDKTVLMEIEHDSTLNTPRTISRYRNTHENALVFIDEFIQNHQKLDITRLFNYTTLDDFKIFVDTYSHFIDWENDDTNMGIKILSTKKDINLMLTYSSEYILTNDNFEKFKYILPKMNVFKENSLGENILTKALGNYDIKLSKYLIKHYDFPLEWKNEKTIHLNAKNKVLSNLSSYQDIIENTFDNNETEQNDMLNFLSAHLENKYLNTILDNRDITEKQSKHKL